MFFFEQITMSCESPSVMVLIEKVWPTVWELDLLSRDFPEDSVRDELYRRVEAYVTMNLHEWCQKTQTEQIERIEKCWIADLFPVGRTTPFMLASR